MKFEGYEFARDTFASLLLRRHFPERNDGESAVILAFLIEHLPEYDSIGFAKRLGHPLTVDPALPESVQRGAMFSSMLKVDILAWTGQQPTLIEVKQHVTPAALGQILTYRHHLLEAMPDVREPRLVVVGRTASPDAVAALQAHGVTVYLYPDAPARIAAAAGGVRPDDGTAA